MTNIGFKKYPKYLMHFNVLGYTGNTGLIIYVKKKRESKSTANANFIPFTHKKHKVTIIETTEPSLAQ